MRIVRGVVLGATPAATPSATLSATACNRLRRLAGGLLATALVLAVGACGEVVVAADDLGAVDTAAGDGAGDAADAPPVGNQAPSVTIKSPAAGAIVNIGSLVHFSATVSDDRDPVDQLTVKWSSTAVPTALLEGKVDASGVSEVDTDQLPAGVQTVRVEVTDSEGKQGASEVKLLVNTAPGAPVIEILPAKPTTIDDLEAQIVSDAADPDRAASELTYSYQWFKNGAPTTMTGAVLEAAQTKKGEVWKVVVKANDPKASSPEASSEVVIGNAAPLPPAVQVQPGAVDLLSDVTCTMTKPGVDPDGDAVTYTYAWLVNGYLNPEATAKSVQVPDLASDDKNTPVKATDKLQCVIVAKDAEATAPAASSPEVLVKGYDVCGSVLNPCDLAASCTNTDTLDVVCTCAEGYTGDGKSCFDIDECLGGVCDLAADCTNTVGSFQCACKPGYAGDGLDCADLDECALGTAGCDLAADCTNTEGSFACACQPGYEGDGFACSDVDECALGTAGCDLAADCSNTVGGVVCTCQEGYTGDGKACADVDECLTDNGGCAADALCTNIPGANLCVCNAGFTGNGKVCDDVDECSLPTPPCSNDALCTNSTGSFACACKPGFSGDGKVCTDVDECAVDNGGCHADATCTNAPGSFACACKPGYAGDGKACADVDECATNVDECAAIATCANTTGSYTCTCPKGYVGDGKSCSFNDLCATNNGGCSANATCKMADEKAVCTCKAGYSGDGKVCADINECANNNGGCSTSAVCTNTAGGFSCACKPGFSGDGKICTDINECANNNGGCSANAVCANSPGAFTCTCKSGFAGDGKVCADINECATNNGGCALDGGACTNTAGSFSCACKPGYSGDGKTCTEIDECKDPSTCSADAVCTNTPGSFSCKCKPGFTGDGKTCTDVDECKTGAAGCSSLATCTNTPGSYECKCNAGYEGDGKTCKDVDECPPVNWTWDFAKQGGAGWSFDAPSVAGTAVKWQVLNGTLYYGNGTNFATGSTKNSGAAVGPVVTMSNHPAHRLSFDLDMQTEMGTNYDRLYVYLVVPGQPLTEIWNKSKHSNQQGWKNYSVDLQGYAGKQVQVRFFFDTWDGVGNNGKGVSINNLKIQAAGGPCSVNATCANTVGSYKCTCLPGYVGDGGTCHLFGSQQAPAKSCKEIKGSAPSMAAGNYWLDFTGVAAPYYCDGAGWTRLSYDTFEGNNAGGWTPGTITACGSNLLGGFNVAGAGYVVSKNTGVLPPHTQVRVQGTFMKIDTWDNEAGWVRIDGVQVWSQTFAAVAGGSTCGDANYSEQGASIYGVANHAAKGATVQVGTTLNEPANNESFGVDNVQIWAF